MIIENFDKIKTLVDERECLMNTVKELEHVSRISLVYRDDARLIGSIDLNVYANAVKPNTNKYIQDLGIRYIIDVKAKLEKEILNIENKLKFL